MSSKAPKPSFNSTQFETLMYPLYMTPHDDLHAAAAATEPSAAGPDHSFFSRSNVEDVQAVAAAATGGGLGFTFAERFKRWSFEQERTIPNSDLQSYTMNPLLSVNNDHNLLSNSAAAAARGAGGSGATANGGGGHVNLLGSLGSSVGDGVNVGFLPLSSVSNTPYPEEGYASTNKPQYSTTHADMEILRVNQGHNTVTGSVHLFEDIPSSLTHQSVGLSAPSNFNLSYNNTTQRALPCTSSFSNLHHSNTHHQSQLLADHHHHPQLGPALRTSSAGTHPHAELLLLPGVAESVVEASPSSATHSAALSGSSKLDLLHVSSLHDKQAPMALPLSVAGCGGGRPPSAVQMWNADKLDMTVGLGLHDNHARSTLSFPDTDHYASMRGVAQSGLSLFLQSPQHRAQSVALSLDAARYNTRSASGSLGVLRNSKYLKGAQQVLNEFCNVCRDGNYVQNDTKSSKMGMSHSNMQWNAGGGAAAAELAGEEGDHGQLSRAFFSTSNTSSAAAQKSNHYNNQLKSSGASNADVQQQQQEKTTPSTQISTTPEQTPKQLPADERCHLQMRKARLIAMVEELDRRYQQYRDQMQLIVTSFESATGMGGAAPYTTLARRAMSRQFRGLRDAISEHIRAVCRMLGEEVSSVPILSRGETPRLRLVDQRLRHQRSLQQIGMLPQQQAWRPQRGLPERSVTVLRAWLFEHFLHPYPKDSEKSMLARLTGLSRNQVSNWFINARVRLWKPMIEEMYIEESKALEMQQDEGTISTGVEEGAAAGAADGDNNGRGTGGMGMLMQLQEGEEQQQQQQQQQEYCAPLRGGGASEALLSSWQHPSHYTNSTATNDLHSFIHFHSSTHAAAAEPSTLHDAPSHAFSWMKPHVQAPAAHDGDIGNIFTHGHHQQHHNQHQHHHHHHQQQEQLSSDMQAAALMQAQQQQQLSSSFMKNGVSLTLGLQQPPPPPQYAASYNSSSSAANYNHVRPSEALLF